jgi:hypothetical protein
MASNWIADRNRYGLPEPPADVMQAFHDQDAALVLVPSNQARKYLLRVGAGNSPSVVPYIAAKSGRGRDQCPRQDPRAPHSDGDLLESLNLLIKVDAMCR